MSLDLNILPRPRVLYAVVFRAPRKRGGGMTKEKWLYHSYAGQMFIYNTKAGAQRMAGICKATPDPDHPERIYSVRPFWGEA